MQKYDISTTRAIRHSVGSLLAIIFFLLWGLATFSAFSMNSNDLPGYPFFYLSCPGLFVCSILLAMGKRGAGRAIQAFSLLAFISLFFTNVRHDYVALALDSLLFGGPCLIAEWVERIVRASRASEQVTLQ